MEIDNLIVHFTLPGLQAYLDGLYYFMPLIWYLFRAIALGLSLLRSLAIYTAVSGFCLTSPNLFVQQLLTPETIRDNSPVCIGYQTKKKTDPGLSSDCTSGFTSAEFWPHSFASVSNDILHALRRRQKAGQEPQVYKALLICLVC